VLDGATEQYLVIDQCIGLMSSQERASNIQQILMQFKILVNFRHAQDSGCNSDDAGLTTTGRAALRKSGPANGKRTAGLGIPLGDNSWVISNSALTDQPQASDVHCR
jgi:hypothetical protein